MTQGTDSLRAVLRGVFARPEYRWVERRDPWHAVRWVWEMVLRWLDALHRAHPAMTKLLEAAVGAALLATVLRAAWLLFHSVRHASADALQRVGDDRLRRDQSWYRAEADRLAVAGRFADAMQHEFLALVLALDAQEVLRFHPSRTPAEYARAVVLPADGTAAFADLVRRLYLYVFARVPLDRESFSAWRDDARVERYARAH